MVLRSGRIALAALIMTAPAFAGDGTFGVPASGILPPPPPQPARIQARSPANIPARTAALVPPDRADLDKQRPVPRVQQTYQPAPAEGAGRSRAVPPSEAPVHSPIVVPPKKKQFKAPLATVDPSYVERIEAGGDEQEPGSVAAPTPATPPVMAQGAAPEPRRGLFGLFRSRNAPPQMAQMQPAQVQAQPVATTPMQPRPVYASAAAAAYEEHVARAPVQAAYAPQPAAARPRSASRLSFSGANPSTRASDGTPCGQLRGLFTSPPECR
jgi:hypothetical protein